jgi:hypothetical protein
LGLSLFLHRSFSAGGLFLVLSCFSTEALAQVDGLGVCSFFGFRELDSLPGKIVTNSSTR